MNCANDFDEDADVTFNFNWEIMKYKCKNYCCTQGNKQYYMNELGKEDINTVCFE